jgi:hypothetical protein
MKQIIAEPSKNLFAISAFLSQIERSIIKEFK